MMAAPWEKYQEQDDGPWSKYASSAPDRVPPIGGEATAISSYSPVRAEVKNWQRAAMNVGRSFLSPVYSLAERGDALASGRPVGPIDSPITRALGGPIPVNPGLKPALGDIVQTAAMIIPGTRMGEAAMMARPVITSGLIGAGFSGGQAASANESMGKIAKNSALGYGIGAAIPAAISGVNTINSGPTIAEIDSAISKKFTKAIRPTVVGKPTSGAIDSYNERAIDAVKTIVENKPNLKIVDEFGEPTGKLPQNLHQFGQAIEQTKRAKFEEYNAMQAAAGESGAIVDLTPVIKELETAGQGRMQKIINPSVAKKAKELSEELVKNGPITPLEAQDAIALLNQKLEPFVKNPTYEDASNAAIDAKFVEGLRTALDKAITESKGPGYQELKNQYGALSAIQKDVAHRTMVNARQNPKGLIDFSDILSVSDLVSAMARQDPAFFATGAAKKSVAAYIKWRNNPNTAIKQMFKEADSALQE